MVKTTFSGKKSVFISLRRIFKSKTLVEYIFYLLEISFDGNLKTLKLTSRCGSMTDKVFLLKISAWSLNARLFSLFSKLLKRRSTHSRPRGTRTGTGDTTKKNCPFSRLLRLPNARVQFLKDAGLNPNRLLLFFPSAREGRHFY